MLETSLKKLLQDYFHSGHFSERINLFSPHQPRINLYMTWTGDKSNKIFKMSDSEVKTPGPGLPDGLFSNQRSQFGKILEGFRVEDAGTYI
jgi:hypothetical protein